MDRKSTPVIIVNLPRTKGSLIMNRPTEIGGPCFSSCQSSRLLKTIMNWNYRLCLLLSSFLMDPCTSSDDQDEGTTILTYSSHCQKDDRVLLSLVNIHSHLDDDLLELAVCCSSCPPNAFVCQCPTDPIGKDNASIIIAQPGMVLFVIVSPPTKNRISTMPLTSPGYGHGPPEITRPWMSVGEHGAEINGRHIGHDKFQWMRIHTTHGGGCLEAVMDRMNVSVEQRN